MYEKRNSEAATEQLINPLRELTRDQFAALGGDAVAYVRSITGDVLSAMITEAQFEPEGDYHLVMSADGTPLLVTDTQDAVLDWLDDKNLGLATLH